MKLVMTLLARDEADIIDAHLSFHLNAGVDFVIATDHRSTDGTTEILESYSRAGVLRLIREQDEFTRQGEWQTRMARLAVMDHEADWVINSDADEFWWPRGLSLKDSLEAVPERYGAVRGLLRSFVPLRDEYGDFTESMTIRLTSAASLNDPATPYRPAGKVAHRGHPEVVVGEGGSHQVFGLPWPMFRAWYPVEIFHLPLRSREQCARKYRKTWTGWRENVRGDIARARIGSDAGRENVIWDRVALSAADVERGIREHSLASDTRLRDAMRALGGSAQVSRLGDHRPSPPDRSELDAHALEAVVFDEAELVRYSRWVDELTARVTRLEAARE